jgi:hypothetical protein
VQYGFSDDDRPTRAPKLRTIFQPIPKKANTASPIYLLTQDQYQRQQRLETGYEVTGTTSIATELQGEAEAASRVLHPVHVESDVLPEEGPKTLLRWFRGFIKDRLNVPFDTCTLYFSGNRSLHAHVPRLVSGPDERERLKQLAETFCTETDANLDCGLYSAKRMFRLPGVKHASTDLRKVEIRPEWGKDRIIRESSTTSPSIPDSYASVLQRVFLSHEELLEDSAECSPTKPRNLFRVLDSDRTVLDLSSPDTAVATPLIEQEECPEEQSQVPLWSQYNAKEFSPYAHADDNPRSVASLRVKRGAFARRGRRSSATMVPAWFYGAVGCNGEYKKKREHAPLQLSDRDYSKRNFQPGDTLVILGGRSRHSRIIEVGPWEARVVGHALTGEDGSRAAALAALNEWGYDVGSAGSTAESTTGQAVPTADTGEIWPARESPQTEAEALQRQAEQVGIQTLSHDERIQVACRHLRHGWQPTWEWFREQFGSEFKPEVTWRQLQSIVNSFQEYSHVEVPPRP